jgi:DNA repair exonuclease SbcCD nuclease subunit
MKVAIITDTHFGVRKGDQALHNHFENFYKNIFFPYLKKNNITTILHLGDLFDVRKNIDYWSLKWVRNVFLDPIKEIGASLTVLAGNHDIFYKNTNNINSPDLLLAGYDNITVISEAQTKTIDNLPICFVPWINTENYESVLTHIDSTKAKVCMGHLEISGFIAHQGYVCETGLDREIFTSKFKKTFSGHFHHRNDDGKVFYLGNPYQMYWNDYADTRGFHIFDTETLRTSFVKNTYDYFHKIFYDDTKQSYYDFNLDKYQATNVKLIVEQRTDLTQFEHLVSNLQDITVDLKIIEELSNEKISLDDFDLEHEDTLTVLEKCIDEYSQEYDTIALKKIIKSLYKEAVSIG